MEIVVTGRNVEVPDHFRVHVADKVSRLERYDHKIVRLEVELFHEPNRRQLKTCQRIEITARGRGPVIRAEACASDFYTALDLVVAKLDERMRRFHGRRIASKRGRAVRAAVGASRVATPTATAVLEQLEAVDVEVPQPRTHDEYLPVDEPRPGRVAEREVQPAEPMSLDDALSRMELVGQDFYLFADAETGRPSVVYRRKGYDYGVIQLAT